MTPPRRKRWRYVTAKAREIKVGWGKVEHDRPDLTAAWGGDGADKADAHMLMNFLTTDFRQLDIATCAYKPAPSLLKELQARGYDLTTLKFSIQKKGGADE